MESLSSMIFVTALIAAVIKLLIYHYERWDLYRAGSKIQGPGPVLPIIGNAHLFFGKPEDALNKVMDKLNSFDSSPVRFWLGHKFCVVLFDPEQIKVVLHSPESIEKDELFDFFRPWLGTGLFTAPANKWRKNRKLIMPTFHPRILESFIDTMKKQSEILVKVMELEINGEEFNIFTYLSLCTLDIICESAMGVSANIQTSKNTTYSKSLDKIMEILFQRMTKVWLHPDIIFNSTKLARDQQKCINYLHKQTDDIIKQKLQKYSEEIKNKDEISQATGSRRKAFLDLLIELSENGANLTDTELREEVNTMIFAANDTTATVLSFVFYMLANFPTIQEKCFEELVEIYGENINEKKQIDNKDLNRMKYLERVIKETMRLFPVAPFLMRQVRADLNIGDGIVVPKGSSFVLAILKLHRSPDLWENPLNFDPDRFLPEPVAKRHPYAYIPFSAGPRNCVGLTYAMMSMKILLATFLQNYVLIKDKHVEIEDIGVKNEMIIRPLNPITVKIKRR